MNTQLTKRNIADLFKGWKRLFRSKMKDEDWDIESVNVWHMVLNDLEITANEFMAAKRKSLGLSWPPTAPADFLALGRAEIASNYPDVRTAYIDAANHRWDEDGILYEAARLVGLSAMREQEERYTYPMFQKHYKDVITTHSQGAVYKVMQVPQIEVKKPLVACDSKTADEYLRKIRELLSENNNDNK